VRPEAQGWIVVKVRVAINLQGFEKRGGVDKVFGDVFEMIRCCPNAQGLESADSMGRDVEEGIVGEQASFPLQPHVDGSRLRAFEVDASLLGVDAVEVRPQRGARCENVSPGPTHVSQRDRNFLSPVAIPEVRNESEYIARESVYRGPPVPHGSNRGDDLPSLLVESI
jgi:hypothetical protein